MQVLVQVFLVETAAFYKIRVVLFWAIAAALCLVLSVTLGVCLCVHRARYLCLFLFCLFFFIIIFAYCTVFFCRVQ